MFNFCMSSKLRRLLKCFLNSGISLRSLHVQGCMGAWGRKGGATRQTDRQETARLPADVANLTCRALHPNWTPPETQCHTSGRALFRVFWTVAVAFPRRESSESANHRTCHTTRAVCPAVVPSEHSSAQYSTARSARPGKETMNAGTPSLSAVVSVGAMAHRQTHCQTNIDVSSFPPPGNSRPPPSRPQVFEEIRLPNRTGDNGQDLSAACSIRLLHQPGGEEAGALGGSTRKYAWFGWWWFTMGGRTPGTRCASAAYNDLSTCPA